MPSKKVFWSVFRRLSTFLVLPFGALGTSHTSRFPSAPGPTPSTRPCAASAASTASWTSACRTTTDAWRSCESTPSGLEWPAALDGENKGRGNYFGYFLVKWVKHPAIRVGVMVSFEYASLVSSQCSPIICFNVRMNNGAWSFQEK